MNLPSYELTKSAEKDLREIAAYTLKNWGVKQQQQYEQKLCRMLQKIAIDATPDAYVFNSILSIFMVRCEKHLVFFQKRATNPPLILAVLHERMDIVRHLSERLKT